MVMTAEQIGNQEPRISSMPEFASSLGVEAAELSASAGLVLDPWQADVLEPAMGVRKDGKWAAFEIGVVVSRQNGKGGILEARELAGLFLLEERLIIHSAHQFDTSLEAFRRLLFLIEDTPDLDRQVRRISRSHGEEGIELKNGCRIRFRTRTKGGGRGFSSDCLILDEAMILPESAHGALLPTLSARPNPQVWYTGSAVDQEIHEDGIVLARIRERGRSGADPSLAYFEWSIPHDEESSPDHVEEEVANDVASWSAANPGLGFRIRAEHIGHEYRSMDARTFAVERLGVGDWPPTDRFAGSVINLAQWQRLLDPTSAPAGSICFAFDVAPNRSSAAISVAGRRSDGLLHIEVVEHKAGTGWVAPKLEALWRKHEPKAILCDAASPAGSLINELEERGLQVESLSGTDHGRACGMIYDLVEQEELRHLGTSELKAAVRGAKSRPLGDSWAWGRKKSSVDITPLVSCTLAVWKAAQLEAEASWAFV